VPVGTNLTYTIQVNNNGRTSFSGVSNFVQFSASVQLLAVSSSKGNWLTNGNQLIFYIGAMTNNEAVSQSITLATSTPRVMTNSATLTSFESASDPNTDNNVATVISTVLAMADVRVSSASASPSPVALTSNLTYSITVDNIDPIPPPLWSW
jgi:uncharacterized repeat protein (TIGR01451 family)